jgi:hypothetical protein
MALRCYQTVGRKNERKGSTVKELKSGAVTEPIQEKDQSPTFTKKVGLNFANS